ncbi:hypothetical protein ACWD6N_06330 [Micromonospora sp. NPDC005163]
MTEGPRGGREVVSNLAAAAAACWRHGRDVVETTDILVELATSIASLDRLLGPRAHDLPEAVRGLPAELASPDAPATRAPAVREAEAVLREATWEARRELRHDRGEAAPAWSAASRAAVTGALDTAAARGVQHAHGMQFLSALLDDPACRATGALTRLGFTQDDILRAVPVGKVVAEEGSPIAFTAGFLAAAGLVRESGGALSRRVRHRLSRLVLRPHAGVVLVWLEQEAIRQTVRLGRADVDSVALLAAILSLDEQLRFTRRTIAVPWAALNAARENLVGHGLDLPTLASRAVPLPSAVTAPGRTYHRRDMTGDPPFGRDAADVVEHARGLPDRRDLGTSHLVLAMLAEPGCAAHALLAGAVDPARLGRELSNRLSA